jgi:hypothetical protein
MDNKHSGKSRGLFGRSKPKEEAAPARPVASLLLILAGAAAQRLLSHHGKATSFTDVQIKAIASGLTRDLTTLSGECARQERLLRTKEARQSLLLGLSFAGLLNVRDQLAACIARYTTLLLQTNPEMPAITLDPARTGVHTLPGSGGPIVDSTLVESSPGGSGPLPRPGATGSGNLVPQQPTLSHLSERELGAFANELREVFAAIIQGVQVVLGALGAAETTGAAQIDSALAQTRALVTWITDEERRLRTAFNIAPGSAAR